MHIGIEDQVTALIRHSAHTIGSDGILVGTAPHPRGGALSPASCSTTLSTRK